MKIVKIGAMWCSACLFMHKIWDDLALKYPEIEIISLDYDLDEAQVQKYQVTEILPVLIFYKKDLEVTRLCGEKSLIEIISIIEKYK